MIGDVWYTKYKYMFHQSLIKCDEKVRLFCMKPSREFSSWAVSENTGATNGISLWSCGRVNTLSCLLLPTGRSVTNVECFCRVCSAKEHGWYREGIWRFRPVMDESAFLFSSFSFGECKWAEAVLWHLTDLVFLAVSYFSTQGARCLFYQTGGAVGVIIAAYAAERRVS